MRIASMLLCICCCLSAVSAQWSGTMTALPDERPVSSGAAVAPTLPTRVGVPFEINIGAVDTIGGTTYDWQFSGPVWRMLVDSRCYGIHAVWMYSADMSNTTFPDRNMRYNFYDSDWGQWNWIDPDFMQSGVSVFDRRSGYGNVDAAPSGEAVVSCRWGAL